MNSSRLPNGARAEIVNRTHRVIRQRAVSRAAHRNRARSLWVPIAVCSSLLVMLCYAAWNMLAQYDLTPSGMPDSSDQLPLLALWFLPVCAAAIAMVWFRRSRNLGENEVNE